MAGDRTQTFTFVSGRGIRKRNENSDAEQMECHLWHIRARRTRGKGMAKKYDLTVFAPTLESTTDWHHKPLEK
jgi:hypothetical protein